MNTVSRTDLQISFLVTYLFTMPIIDNAIRVMNTAIAKVFSLKTGVKYESTYEISGIIPIIRKPKYVMPAVFQGLFVLSRSPSTSAIMVSTHTFLFEVIV